MANLSVLTDEQLVQAYLAGEPAAFDVLVRRNLNQVFNFVFKYVHTQTEAEDVAQESFLKIWKNLKKFNPKYKFKTWALTIAKNTALDRLKKKGLVPFTQMDDVAGGQFAETLTSSQPLAEELLGRLDDIAMIGHALAKLPDSQREILDLYYEQGFNFREISELLKQSANTIKTRHRRAILALRKYFKEKVNQER